MSEKMHLLILHGWNHSSEVWQNAYQQLDTSKVTIHIPDLPGFGQEPLVSPDWSIPDYAEWVEKKVDKILKTENCKQLTILGHSFGGRIAAYLASQNPPWLQHLILYAAPVLYRPTLQTKTKIALYKIGKRLTFGTKFLREFIAHAHHQELQHADQHHLGQIYRSVINFDQTSTLPKIQIPTDIIIGSHDTEVRQLIAQQTHELINNSTLHILENQSHNIHLDNPILFYGLIRKLLND